MALVRDLDSVFVIRIHDTRRLCSGMIYGLAIWLITLAIDLWTDLHLWYSHKPVKHIRGALLRMIGLAPACWLIGWYGAAMLCLCYWALFDSAWGKLTGSGWFYTGSTSWLDKLQARAPIVKIFKYIGAIASIILFICSIHRQI